MTTLLALLAITYENAGRISWDLHTLAALVDYVPHSAPISLETSPDGMRLVVTQLEGKGWRLESALGGIRTITIYGDSQDPASSSAAGALLKALKAVSGDRWRFPIRVKFRHHDEWYAFHISRLPLTPGGDRFVRVHRKTGEVNVIKGR